MKKTLMIAVGVCAVAFAAPAYAETCTSGSTGVSPLVTNPAYLACAQFAGNLNNASNIGAINTGFDAVGYTGADLTFGPLDATKSFYSILNGDLLQFQTALVGDQFFAVHFGSAGGDKGAYNDTLFFHFQFPTATSSVDLNRLGYSNAIGVIGGMSGAVPEPATWAMMLLGFGAIGSGLRRSRRKDGKLLQLA